MDTIIYLKWMLTFPIVQTIYQGCYTCHKNGADMCVGSRYVPGGKIINWPKSRFWLSYASLYVRLILGMKIKDTTAGFGYSRKVLEKLILIIYGLWVMPFRLK